ncbi:sugar isomerase [candidate division KSB1 bacterium]|nr:MAG: sugar isomerase [candidate division KSB1 bacterium]
MIINEENLKRLDEEFSGYLEGDSVTDFLETFDINFAAGHWCAGDFADRFATEGYNPDMSSSIVSQIKRIAEAGIKGVEFHERVFINKNFKKDSSIISSVKDALSEFKVKPTNMNTNLFTDPKWKLGGITNPDKKIREDAIAVALQGVEIAKEVGCKSVALWPGSDGWDYNFQVNYGKILDYFIEGCIEINNKAKENGMKFGIEAKLKEPREGNMIIATTQKAALVAKEVNSVCGGENMGVCIDYGHEQMYAYEPADNLYTLKRFGIPVVNFHINTAKLHSNDEDRVAGTGDVWRFADFCFSAIDTGYQGWFGEDQFTYRMEPVKAMALSREFFANIMKKALLIYRIKEKLIDAQLTGDAGKTLDVVKKFLL